MASVPHSVVDRIDDAIFGVEKAVVAAILSSMGVVVFLDVINRVSTRSGGLFANPVVVLVTAVVVSVFALRTRGDSGWLPKGVALGVALVAVQRVFLWLIPNGMVWSQTFALSLTLWMGTVGASLAAHERRHLAMDIGGQLWPKAWAGKIAAVGHLVTALFAATLAWLGSRSVGAHWDLWTATHHEAGNLSGLPIPQWFPALAIPYGMGMVSLRFLKDAWYTWNGLTFDDGEDPLKALGLQAHIEGEDVP